MDTTFRRKNSRTLGGVYSNPRFSHLLATLVGCPVHVQVKNGGIYDGILKTISPKLDIVLEVAHKHDESSNNNTNNTTPAKDRLIDKVVFNMADILAITSVDVDLDYAVKDKFTDTAISKCNSYNAEADMKVLQPWDGGEGDELDGLEKESSSNGWDPNEMFRINKEKFNVQSKYDDSLKQYTTPLKKRDTKEFKKREEEAERLASEIERSKQYKQHISLENGEGDEEDKFSAVKRTSENSLTNIQTSGNPGKYIPPNKRGPGMQGNRGRGYMPNQRPPNQIPPRLQNQRHHHHHQNFHQNHSSAHHYPPHHQTSTEEPRLKEQLDKDERDRRSEDRKADDRVKRDKRPEEKKSDIDTNVKSSPKQEPVTQHVSPEKPDPVPHTSPVPPKLDRRSSGPNSQNRAEVIKDLKEFNNNFKVSFEGKKEESKDHKELMEAKSKGSGGPTSSSTAASATPAVAAAEPPAPPTAEEILATESKATEQQAPQEKDPNFEIVKKSNLNPLAKEFVMGKGRKQQVLTPPQRPQTQSPVGPGIMQQISQPMPHQFIPTYTVMPPAVVNQATQPGSQQNYKAVKRDTFMDTAMSKCNSYNAEADMKVLQPWDGMKKSNLNPLAKEFVMGKGREQQVLTPSQRPQTQSPVGPGIMQQISQPMPHQFMPTYTVMPPAVVNQATQLGSQQNYKAVKRAVVSVGPRNDLTAAQAATGQPLFNQTTVQPQPYNIQYIPNYQAVMPMPAATGRMVTPTSMPMVPTSHGAQSNQSHQYSIFMPDQAQPMPAHLPAAQFPYPAHMPMATSNMSNQANQGGQPQQITHPAPSPVQQHGNSQTHQQGRPPNSGTPQPPGGPYPHMPANIQGHPPLIPSPQNQTPQTMHNAYLYSQHQHHIFPQGTTGQLYTQQHMPTSGNQMMHAGPTSQLGHGAQIVVMPNPQPGQHHLHNQQQFQQHMGGPNQQHMIQPAGMMQPTGMSTGYQGSNPSNVVHPSFVPQVANGPPPVATVPPFQQTH